MERYRNIGYMDIGGNCSYNKSFFDFYDLLHNKRVDCNFILKGYGAENGSIIVNKEYAYLNGTNQIQLKITYKETPLDHLCVFDLPTRIELKIPKRTYFIRDLQFNLIDPTPDFTYQDGKFGYSMEKGRNLYQWRGVYQYKFFI